MWDLRLFTWRLYLLPLCLHWALPVAVNTLGYAKNPPHFKIVQHKWENAISLERPISVHSPIYIRTLGTRIAWKSRVCCREMESVGAGKRNRYRKKARERKGDWRRKMKADKLDIKRKRLKCTLGAVCCHCPLTPPPPRPALRCLQSK